MSHLLLTMTAALALAGSDSPPATPAPAPAPIDVVGALEGTLIEAIARAEPSVVAIARLKGDKGEATTAVRGREPLPAPPQLRRLPNFAPQLNPNFGDDEDPAEYVASDYGSGVVIGPGNEILTAFSVVQGATRLVVRAKGAGYFDAEVIAADPRTDLAVIVPRDDPRRKPPPLRAIALGDSTRLRKGSFLLALGNPFNSSRDGLASASWGILGNIARRLDSDHLLGQPNLRQLRHYPTLLQLDSKLNLGMSGGAVVNLRGELVGLTTDAANVGGFDAQAGYAMPIDAIARRAIDALRQGREVEYGFLGIQIDRQGTNRIAGLQSGTPAGEGGLLPDDVIVGLGDLPVADADSLILAVNAFAPGVPVAVRVRRGDKEVTRNVTLAKLPVVGEVIATNRPASWRGLRVDYLSTSIRPNDPFGIINNGGLDRIEAKARGGVIVTEVQPGSAADDAEIRPGLIITAVDGIPVRTPNEFARVAATRQGPATCTVEGNLPIIIK